MKHLDTFEKLRGLDDGSYSLGVPIHPDDGSILLNGLGDKRKMLKSRIAVDKDGNSLQIAREDIFPIQIVKFYEKKRVKQSLMPAPVSIMGMRRVLMIPESGINAYCDDLQWSYGVFLNDTKTGPEDFSEFLGKIVQIANAKQNKLKSGR